MTYQIKNETQAVARLLVKCEHALLNDPDCLMDTIEGETSYFEALDKALAIIVEKQCFSDALKSEAKKLLDKAKRFEGQADDLKMAISSSMQEIDMRSIKRPLATLSITSRAPKLIGDNVDNLDKRFLRVKYEPDKKAIKEALEAGEIIEGWVLSNGGEGLTMRVA